MFSKAYFGELSEQEYDSINATNLKVLEELASREEYAHQKLNETEMKLLEHFQLKINKGFS